MARQRNHRQINTAGLEADVMRFMAIIAFCLIAIMALVKDVEPQTTVEAQAALVPQAAPVPQAVPAPQVTLLPQTGKETPAFPGTKTALVSPQITMPQETKFLPEQKVEPLPAVAVNLVSEQRDLLKTNQDILADLPLNEILNDILATSYSPVETKSANSNPADSPEQEIITAEVESEKNIQFTDNKKNTEPATEVLTFRFDSDATFMHLIATNNLKLFASTSNGFLEMDPAFNVTSAKPSGELFEIMRQSIPSNISSRFEKKSQSPVYLVALPRTTRQDLNEFLESPNIENKTGVLVIHQDGRISHEI